MEQKNSEGQLLKCPNCSTSPHYTSFGSITGKGDIIVLRKFNRRTIVVAKDFVLLCDCGYSVTYQGGKVTSSDNGNGYDYEKI